MECPLKVHRYVGNHKPLGNRWGGGGYISVTPRPTTSQWEDVGDCTAMGGPLLCLGIESS